MVSSSFPSDGYIHKLMDKFVDFVGESNNFLLVFFLFTAYSPKNGSSWRLSNVAVITLSTLQSLDYHSLLLVYKYCSSSLPLKLLEFAHYSDCFQQHHLLGRK